MTIEQTYLVRLNDCPFVIVTRPAGCQIAPEALAYTWARGGELPAGVTVRSVAVEERAGFGEEVTA